SHLDHIGPAGFESLDPEIPTTDARLVPIAGCAIHHIHRRPVDVSTVLGAHRSMDCCRGDALCSCRHRRPRQSGGQRERAEVATYTTTPTKTHRTSGTAR